MNSRNRNRNSTLELLLAAFLIKIITGHIVPPFFSLNISHSAFPPPFLLALLILNTLHLESSQSLFREWVSNIPELKVFKKEKTNSRKFLSQRKLDSSHSFWLMGYSMVNLRDLFFLEFPSSLLPNSALPLGFHTCL
jgi:hypothetical protein